MATRYATESISADERRQARLAMVVLGLACLGMCMMYLVLAAGEILG
jgi:hypothetical protein